MGSMEGCKAALSQLRIQRRLSSIDILPEEVSITFATDMNIRTSVI